MHSLPFSTDNPIEVFFSYSHKDEGMQNELVKHLSPLKQNGMINYWYDRMIPAGSEWVNEIDKHLDTAQIILLLVSSDFLASEYCYSIEMKHALSRHENDKALVIPIILRYVNWHNSPFGKLQSLPKNGKPVTSHRDLDEAFTDIAQSISQAIQTMKSKCNSSKKSLEIGDRQSEEKESLFGKSGNIQNSKKSDSGGIELTLDRDFDSYTEEDKNRLLEAIKNLLEINSNIKIVREQRGSVKLTLQLPPEQAEQLLWAARGGKLEEFGVISAELVDLEVADTVIKAGMEVHTMAQQPDPTEPPSEAATRTRLWTWIVENKTWVFGGIGTAILMALLVVAQGKPPILQGSTRDHELEKFFELVLEQPQLGSDSIKADLCVSVANALRDAGRNAKAMIFYKKALIFNPREFDALWSLGGLEMAAERYSKAINYYERAFSSGTGDTLQEKAFLLDHWAWALSKDGQIAEAKAKYEEVIHLGARQKVYVGKARYNLALLMEKTKQLNEAGELMNKAREEAKRQRNTMLDVNPDEAARAMFHLAIIETHTKNYQKALDNAKQAAKINPMWGQYVCTDPGLKPLWTHDSWKSSLKHAFPRCNR